MTKWALLVSLIVVLLVAVKRLRRLMYLAMTICGFDAGLLATVWVKTYCNVLWSLCVYMSLSVCLPMCSVCVCVCVSVCVRVCVCLCTKNVLTGNITICIRMQYVCDTMCTS